MGTYTPNYNLYMPSIGEQGWGELVSNNFEILDTNLTNLQTQITTNLNNLQDQIDAIDTNIGNGTRTLTLTGNSQYFQQYWDGNVYITYINGNYTMSESIKPSSSARMCLLICNGNLTITGNLNTYPTTLQSELPPGTPETNTYKKGIIFSNFNSCTLTYTANKNNSQLTMNYNDYLTFLGKLYILSIPHAIAAVGTNQKNGTAGTAENTCNGGGGGSFADNNICVGGTGCIFGQYAGGNNNSHRNGYGYGEVASNKYRCGLVIIAFGNLTITGTITQIGGNGSRYNGGYGGGGNWGGGGGAPVFIYYTGSYVNNGTINTAGGSGYSGGYTSTNGGAGGIKTTILI